MTAQDMFELVDVDTGGWGAVADYNPAVHGGVRPGNDQVFVHHTGTTLPDGTDTGDVDAEMASLRAIERYARRNGWWGLAYDAVVGQSGTVYGGRGLARSGATSGDVDDDGTHNNDEGEAILVLVSSGTPMTAEARATLGRLLDAHGGDPYGHREAKGTRTSCPGDDRMAFINAYRTGDLDPAPVPDLPPTLAPAPKPTLNWTETIVDNLPLLKRRYNLKSSYDSDRRAQGLLAAAGALTIAPNLEDGVRFDGKFGPSTEKAVKDFQRHAGLADDGIVGPNTWTALLGG